MNPNEDGWKLTDEESAAEALAARSHAAICNSGLHSKDVPCDCYCHAEELRVTCVCGHNIEDHIPADFDPAMSCGVHEDCDCMGFRSQAEA